MSASRWGEVAERIAAAPYPVEVLPVEAERAAACLAGLEITTGSWLGAVIVESGGLLVDHGWLRVLGGGHGGLPNVVSASDLAAGRVTVALDVMGGQFVWMRGRTGTAPTVHYFGPEDLTWDDLELGYGDWLDAMLSGGATGFYEPLRWPGWEAEVAEAGLDQGIHTLPPPWTAEGKDLSAVSRRAIGLRELVDLHEDTARQLGFL
ncbi:DUF2625 family protein [Actinoplanes sp. LDG1-06]|uniref:DUF2625 family protein n=2 Tax=Paractinoplanes ovalisporus TaxID=2810368 RepID=A0ABS2AFQ6_9ACTN|nr:DUF2625 family protein [Actinoplanes ovalisporus]